MNSTYENKEDFKIAGISAEMNSDSDYQKLRDSLFNKVSKEDLKALGDGTAYALKEFNAMTQSYNYTVGFDLEDEKKAKELDLLIKPILEGNYLVIPVKTGDGEDIKNVYDYVYKEYFPNRKYFHALSPDVEAYYPDKTEIRIPLMANPHKD